MTDSEKPNGTVSKNNLPGTGSPDDGGTEPVPESLPPRESEELSSLLKAALGAREPEPVDVLSGVQARLRERSRGKFYDDGWSTSKAPPISTYLITSLVMLAVVLAVYAILAPLSGEPADIDTTPKPVQIVPQPTQGR